ncbi:MAG: hypothetical protein MZW92_53760 [Comamonadaceae bacterium]|nr:hypothetical protein [Comamonadaceae bacterium]
MRVVERRRGPPAHRPRPGVADRRDARRQIDAPARGAAGRGGPRPSDGATRRASPRGGRARRRR